MGREDLNSLRRMQHFKQIQGARLAPLGEEMVDFFKQAVIKRQTKLAKIAECWGQLVPEHLSDHCALHGLSRGTLTVLVDSSVQMYELKQLLLAGLETQLLMACKAGGVKKIVLKPGKLEEEARPRRKEERRD